MKILIPRTKNQEFDNSRTRGPGSSQKQKQTPAMSRLACTREAAQFLIAALREGSPPVRARCMPATAFLSHRGNPGPTGEDNHPKRKEKKRKDLSHPLAPGALALFPWPAWITCGGGGRLVTTRVGGWRETCHPHRTHGAFFAPTRESLIIAITF
jgi:hypothetical protein